MTFVMVGLRMAPAILPTSARTEAAAMMVRVQVDTESAVHVRHLLHHLCSKQSLNMIYTLNVIFIYIPVTLTCGEVSSENCTYFESSSPVAGACTVTICPCNNDICQVSSAD